MPKGADGGLAPRRNPCRTLTGLDFQSLSDILVVVVPGLCNQGVTGSNPVTGTNKINMLALKQYPADFNRGSAGEAGKGVKLRIFWRHQKPNGWRLCGVAGTDPNHDLTLSTLAAEKSHPR